jgi:lipopolysaccharide export system permease protein
MQFLWKYVDDMAGKGLEWTVIFELLFYASATLVPMALPLAILLSSIMTIGALGEHLELVAVKASGMSLLRLLRPLIYFVALVSILAFMFSNYTLPVANFKLRSLLAAVRAAKPAIDLVEGAFYSGIKGITVYIEEKNINGKSFKGVLVYDHSTDGKGASVVTLAERGNIRVTGEGNWLILTLHNGVRYDDHEFYSQETKNTRFFKESFIEQELWVDISDAKVSREGMGFMRSSMAMMNISQLNDYLLKRTQEMEETSRQMAASATGLNRFNDEAELFSITPQGPDFNPIKEASLPDFSSKEAFWLQVKSHQREYLQKQFDLALRTSLARTEDIERMLEGQMKSMVSAQAEWHRKFTLSFACFVLFFIGAPLGAIIRKGGLGLPLIVCVLIFIGYHVMTSISETAVKNLVWEPAWGMWLPNLVLLPFGLLLTLKISTDSPWFMLDTYAQITRKWRRKT